MRVRLISLYVPTSHITVWMLQSSLSLLGVHCIMHIFTCVHTKYDIAIVFIYILILQFEHKYYMDMMIVTHKKN